MNKAVYVILHWNTDYAEIPRKELPKVVEKSYNTMLSSLEGFEGTIICNITGRTVEYLLQHFPETVDKLKNLIASKTIELVGTGYSHPILPLIHPIRMKQQILDQKKLLEKTFSVNIKGFWPPELAISPLVLKYLKELDYNWLVIDHEHLLQSQTLKNVANPYEKRKYSVTEVLMDAYLSSGFLETIKKNYKALRYTSKFNELLKNSLETVKYNNTASMKAVISSQSWSNSTRIALGNITSLYNESKHLKMILKSKNKTIPLYTLDIEFFGYIGIGEKITQPKSFVSFLNKLNKLNIPIISPSSLSDDEWNPEPTFINTGSWSENKSFSIWTDGEDNKELTRELEVIYSILSQKNWGKELMNKIEPFLRIAECSDARGWGPIPERKLESYTAMQEIYKILGID